MISSIYISARHSIGAVAATAVVALAGLVFEQGHLSALPQGTVEVGQLTPVETVPMTSVVLPEIVVRAARIDGDQGTRRAARQPEAVLPALTRAAAGALLDGKDAARADSAPAAGVLLK